MKTLDLDSTTVTYDNVSITVEGMFHRQPRATADPRACSPSEIGASPVTVFLPDFTQVFILHARNKLGLTSQAGWLLIPDGPEYIIIKHSAKQREAVDQLVAEVDLACGAWKACFSTIFRDKDDAEAEVVASNCLLTMNDPYTSPDKNPFMSGMSQFTLNWLIGEFTEPVIRDICECLAIENSPNQPGLDDHE